MQRLGTYFRNSGIPQQLPIEIELFGLCADTPLIIEERKMSHSRNVIEFVAGRLEKRYKCIQCHNVLQDPVQSSCGHR